MSEEERFEVILRAIKRESVEILVAMLLGALMLAMGMYVIRNTDRSEIKAEKVYYECLGEVYYCNGSTEWYKWNAEEGIWLKDVIVAEDEVCKNSVEYYKGLEPREDAKYKGNALEEQENGDAATFFILNDILCLKWGQV